MGSRSPEVSSTSKSNSIYDLSIREIEVVLQKFEEDNGNLRRELHEARIMLNQKDEEILRLRRELLSSKKENLSLARKNLALTELRKHEPYVPKVIEVDVSTIPEGGMSGNDENDGVKRVSSEDVDQHVRAPLSYQYRHLRLQLPGAGYSTSYDAAAAREKNQDDSRYDPLN